MTLCRTVHNKNYTVINNTIATDNRLSWKAKGIWMYAFSRPDNWQFYVADIIKQSTEGRDAVHKGLKELEDAGYLERHYPRTNSGNFGKAEFIFHETPVKKSLPCTENPSAVNPSADNPPLLSTNSTNHSSKEEFKEKKSSSRNSVPPSEQSFGLADLLFEKVKENLGKPPKDYDQTKWAIEIDRMHRIDGCSYEKIRELIEFAMHDNFWHKTILSAKSLRDKQDTLALRLKAQKKSPVDRRNHDYPPEIRSQYVGDLGE